MRPTRPRLKLALARAWRDDATLQVGVDASRAKIVGGLAPPARRVLDLLDGTRTRETLEQLAAEQGLDPGVVSVVIDALACAGLLEEASVDPGVLRSLEADGDGRLACELAALSLLRSGATTPIAALARRRAGQVALVGDRRLTGGIAELLVDSGVGRVRRYDSIGEVCADAGSRRRADVIVAAHVGVTPWDTLEALSRARTPHLAVGVREVTGIVGPLVVPGAPPCLRCLELHRRDRDPDWPVVAVQLARQPAHLRAYPSALAAIVAGTAALQLLDHLDGLRPVTAGGTLEISLPDWRLRRRSWTSHPECGCGWLDVG